MENISHLPHIIISFVIVLSVIVFIHEFGHYFVAKLCGVRITTFSIGFGKELFGINDRSGTRWKVSLLPLGGYVKMFGDSSAASTADNEALDNMDAQERKTAFHYKKLWQKALIVVAGPVANFLLSIAIFTYFIASNGLPSVEPIVGNIVAESPAQKAGLQIGDRITAVNNDPVETFNDIPYLIATNLDTPVDLHVVRGDKNLIITVIPKQVEEDDGLGNKINRPLIGIRSAEMKVQDVGLARAIGESTKRTYMICVSTLKVIGQIITGKRDTHDLQGPVGIAKLSGQAADKDVNTVLWLIALISANLGLMNLLPIPVLDGGHLAFYTIEALRGRAMAQKTQEYGFRIGFALLAMLMAFSFINDLRRLAS